MNMNIRDYIRSQAAKQGWIKYYSTLRPVSIGTQPTSGFMDFINHDTRTLLDGKMVWAELYYDHELTRNEMEQYDLIRA